MDFIKPTAITDALFFGSNVPETEYDEWIGGTGVYAALSQTSRHWRGMAAAPDGDIYACVYGGDIYKQTAGAGDFAALSQTSRNWAGMAAAPNGDIYACVYDGDIYKQTNGTGDFIALSQTSRYWYGMAAAPDGDIYACVYRGDIYKQTNGTGDFIALSQTSRDWYGIAAAPNGDIYACVYGGGDIYKQTNGTGNFVALSQTSRYWRGMTADTDGNVYACVSAGDIYKQTGGAGNFVALSQTLRTWHSMAAAPDGDIYAGVIGGDIYKSSYVPSYSQENRVVKSHVVYESLTNNNKNNDPATDTTNWLEIGPTNRWACFDGTIGNQSTQAESMTYILAPGAIDSVALLNIESTSVRVDVVDDDNTEITGTVSRAAMKISAVDGTAFVDFGLPAVLTNGVAQKAKLTITDSAGKKLVGYIKAAGTGETYNDVLAGWDFTSGWINHSKATINDANTFTTTSAGGIRKNDFLTELACYRANFTANVSSSSGAKLIGYSISLATGFGSELSVTQPVVNFYNTTAPSFTSYLLRNNDAATTDVTSLKAEQVLTPSATGVTITSTPDGSTYNWESQESGFNYNDASGYSYTLSLIYYKTVTTGPSKTDLVLLDLPLGHPAAEITITIENTGGTAKVGEIIVGIKTYLGAMRYSPSIGITDYSTKTVDAFGHYSIVPRTFAKRMKCGLIILNTVIDEIIRLLTLYRSTELVWIGDANYNSLIIYGYYKDFQVVFARPLSSDCALEIEGLT